MRDEYGFSEARRGPVVEVPPGESRITIGLDEDVVQWFTDQMQAAGSEALGVQQAPSSR